MKDSTRAKLRATSAILGVPMWVLMQDASEYLVRKARARLGPEEYRRRVEALRTGPCKNPPHAGAPVSFTPDSARGVDED